MTIAIDQRTCPGPLIEHIDGVVQCASEHCPGIDQPHQSGCELRVGGRPAGRCPTRTPLFGMSANSFTGGVDMLTCVSSNNLATRPAGAWPRSKGCRVGRRLRMLIASFQTRREVTVYAARSGRGVRVPYVATADSQRGRAGALVAQAAGVISEAGYPVDASTLVALKAEWPKVLDWAEKVKREEDILGKTTHEKYQAEYGQPLTWTPDWLSVSGLLVVECPPGVGHLGGCPVGVPEWGRRWYSFT